MVYFTFQDEYVNFLFVVWPFDMFAVAFSYQIIKINKYWQLKCKDEGVNMEDKGLIKCVISH